MRRRALLLAAALAFAALQAGAQGIPVPGLAAAGIEATAAENFAADRQIRSAMASLRAGQPQKAIDELVPVVGMYETRFNPQRWRAYTSRTPEEARAYQDGFRKAVAVTPATAQRPLVAAPLFWSDALYLRAYALVELQNHAEAEAALKSALALAPLNARYRIELGAVFTARGDLPSALQALLQAARDAQAVSPPAVRDAEVTRAWAGAAFANLKLGRLADAERLYRQCLQMDPKDQVAQRGLEQVRDARAGGGAGGAGKRAPGSPGTPLPAAGGAAPPPSAQAVPPSSPLSPSSPSSPPSPSSLPP